jgi:hypothetical protein
MALLARSGEQRTEMFVAPRMDGPAFGDDVAILTASLPAALDPQPDRPVFTDETGLRAALVQWGGRGGCLLGALLCTALLLTLQTHVSLPSLQGALLSSSEGLRPTRGGVSHTLGEDAAPRTELRGQSGQIRVAGQPGQLAEPTLDSAATGARAVAETPITAQRVQRVAVTSASDGSGATQPVAGTPSASPPTSGAEHGSTRAAAVRGSGASKDSGSAATETHEPSAASKLRNPHATPKTRNPPAANPGSGRDAHSTH